ncbi:MAG: protein kinase [Planctomycetaceae bacterium]|nr:protein kinase [Planctomycetaceae bacterium]
MTNESQDANPIDEVAEEFVARYRYGERPSLTEYISRYPELAEEIRELFPTLILMEQARPSEGPLLPHSSSFQAWDTHPERFSEYRIVREIGRGGMGIVYEAIQESLGRQVALKVLPQQVISKTSQAERFKREAQAAARLNHPNIVPVFGVGEHNGTLYYAMQLIRGLGLDQIAIEVKRLHQQHTLATSVPQASQNDISPPDCTLQGSLTNLAEVLFSGGETHDSGKGQTNGVTGQYHSENSSARVSLRSKSGSHSRSMYYKSVARIGEQVALALQYAADQGVVHRDIKPANLLLDLQGKVWITDFGLASDLSRDGITETGDIIGTIRYMAPERLKGISTPSVDVYSLGATLYELVTLEPMFGHLPREQILQSISQALPKRPSAIDSSIPHDLETIILKALAKDPHERYENSKSLADDLRFFLEDKPIKARRLNPNEIVWKWCRRNPAVATLLTFSSILLMILSMGIWISSIIRHERDEAIRQRELAQIAQEKSTDLFVRASAAEKEARIREHLAKGLALQQSRKEGQRFRSLEEFRQAALLKPSADLSRKLVDNAISTLALTDIEPELEFNLDINAPACFNHRGTKFVQIRSHEPVAADSNIGKANKKSAYSDFSLLVRDFSDWSKVTRYKGPDFPCYFATLEFSYDDRFLYVTYLLDNKSDILTCYETQNFTKVFSVEVSTGVRPNFTQQPTKNWIAYQTPQSQLVVFDVDNQIQLASRNLAYLLNGLCFNHTGTELAVIPDDGTVIKTLDAATLNEKHTLLSNDFDGRANLAITWSSDGQLIATSRTDGTIAIWNAPQKRLCSILRGHVKQITDIGFSRHGHLLRSVSFDDSSRLWDASSGELLLISERNLLGFTTDDRITFTTKSELTAGICTLIHQNPIGRLHDPADGNATLGHRSSGIRWATLSHDERLLFIHRESFIDIWEISTSQKLAQIDLRGCNRILFDPNGRYFLTLLNDRLLLWPIHQSLTTEINNIHYGPPTEVDLGLSKATYRDFSDARWIGKSSRIAVFDCNSSQVIVRDLTHPVTPDPNIKYLNSIHSRVSDINTSPNGKWLVAGTHFAHEVQIWNLENLERRVIVPQPNNTTPSFSPGFTEDSRFLVLSCGSDVFKGGHVVFDIESLNPVHEWNVDLLPGLPVLFSTRNWLVSVGGPNEIRVINVRSGEVLSTIRFENARLNIPVSMLHADSKLAIISGMDASDIQIWNLAKIQESLKSLGLEWEFDIPPSPTRFDTPIPKITFDDNGLIESLRIQQLNRDTLQEAEKLASFGRIQESLQRLRSIESYSRFDSRTLNNIAWYLASSRESLPEACFYARALAESAVDSSPHESSYWNTLGTVLFRQGLYPEAIRAFSQSEALEPGTYLFENGIFLAMSYAQIAEPDLAKLWFEVARKEFAKSPSDSERMRLRQEAYESLPWATGE